MRWIFSLLVFVPSTLFADGVLISPPASEILELNQLAVLKHSGDSEELCIVVRFEGNTNDFAWIIPAPSQPSVDPASRWLFDELAHLSRPIYRDRGMECGCEREPVFGPGGYDGTGRVGEGGVDIVGEGTVGLLNYLILHATEPGVLKDSLESWGYGYPGEAESLFRYYIEKGWDYFVAARADTSGVGGWPGYYYGNLQPLKISFESAHPVYPMKISSLSSGGTELVLYVIAQHRMTFDGSTLKFAQSITNEELDWIREQYPSLVELFQGARFLSKLGKWFDEEEMEDITPRQAEDDQEYREIIFTGVPGDGLILASLVCLIALWSIRKRRAGQRTRTHLMS